MTVVRRGLLGCGGLLLLCGALIVRACQPGPGASYVQLDYPELPGAPALTTVRVLWSADKVGEEELPPGQPFASLMYPLGGGGEMTVLCTIDGKQHVWQGYVGRAGDNARWGVQIAIDPLGTILVKHCKHPCAGSERPWYEPWRTRTLELFGLLWSMPRSLLANEVAGPGL
jgi:hypothetical protein